MKYVMQYSLKIMLPPPCDVSVSRVYVPLLYCHLDICVVTILIPLVFDIRCWNNEKTDTKSAYISSCCVFLVTAYKTKWPQGSKEVFLTMYISHYKIFHVCHFITVYLQSYAALFSPRYSENTDFWHLVKILRHVCLSVWPLFWTLFKGDRRSTAISSLMGLLSLWIEVALS